ncbi:hypothetical protein [Nesterenkonia ebinurensis]|uniref:hypothetical protein n=1 Tax=Nesterenkonia ebinurensis TaxID=2608252 RepID=UPI00123E201C|nr:hypothetical protein [Nesterenkonia ebinurensis]
MIAAAGLVTLSACGGGSGADYSFAEQLDRIPAEHIEQMDYLLVAGTNYDRLEEITGEPKPEPPDLPVDEDPEAEEQWRDWFARTHAGPSPYDVHQGPSIISMNPQINNVMSDELGADTRHLSHYVEATAGQWMFLVGQLPESAEVYETEDEVLDSSLSEHLRVATQDQALVAALLEDEQNLLEPAGETLADDEDLLAAAEAIDAEPWYSAQIITALPNQRERPDFEPLEEYLWLGFAVDEVEGEHTTRVVFVHEESETAEINAERFEAALEASDREHIEFMEAETDGRVLTVHLRNDPEAGPSLFQMAAWYFEPMFGYNSED